MIQCVAIVAIVAMLFAFLQGTSAGKDPVETPITGPAEVILNVYPPVEEGGIQITYEVWDAILHPPPLPDRNPRR